MVTKIKITNRIAFRNGDYTEEVTDGKIVMVFEKRSIANNTFKTMNKQSAEGEITYDDKFTITRLMKGLKEKDIVEIIKEELDYVIKNKVAVQKIKYEVY